MDLLTIRGSENILYLLRQYKNEYNTTENDPPAMRGHLHKQGRKGPRYFEVAELTPLVLYWRSRQMAKAGLHPSSAIDLSKATSINYLEEEKTHFYIESSTENLRIVLQAESVEDAKLWVDTLNQRKMFFQTKKVTLHQQHHSRSTQDLVNSGKRLIKMTSNVNLENDERNNNGNNKQNERCSSWE